MPRLIVIVLVCLIATTGNSVNASTVLGTSNIYWGNGSAVIDTQTNFYLGFINRDRTQFLGLFSMQLSEGDDGVVFSVSSGAIFNSVASLLTNGINDSIYSEVEAGGLEATEGWWFFGNNSGSNGIDFYGSTIERIDLVINSVSMVSPGTDPNHNGIWTDYSGNATLNIIGSTNVPLPGAFLLFGSGVLSLLVFGRKPGQKGAPRH